MEVVILFAEDGGLCRRHGFVRVDDPLTWVEINGCRTMGVARR
jgi:hypothetical protein